MRADDLMCLRDIADSGDDFQCTNEHLSQLLSIIEPAVRLADASELLCEQASQEPPFTKADLEAEADAQDTIDETTTALIEAVAEIRAAGSWRW